ncbi:hypothetical protein ES703_32042 [subsurface metagenome]
MTSADKALLQRHSVSRIELIRILFLDIFSPFLKLVIGPRVVDLTNRYLAKIRGVP